MAKFDSDAHLDLSVFVLDTQRRETRSVDEHHNRPLDAFDAQFKGPKMDGAPAPKLIQVPAWWQSLAFPPKRKQEYLKPAELIAKTYSLPVENLLALISQLHDLKQKPKSARAAFNPDRLTDEETSWKVARRTLRSLANQLKAAEPFLHKVSQDDVMCRAIGSQHYDVPSLVRSFLKLQEVAANAAGIEGRHGRRSHPRWQQEAKKLCEHFWQAHRPSDSSRGYFNKVTKPGRNRNDTEVGNAFSSWFYEVMRAVDPRITTSNCKTILRQK